MWQWEWRGSPRLDLSQTIFGTILGTVTDPTGAVLPGIIVTVTNQGENISHEVVTDSQGNYQAENLKEGLYSVAVHASGFHRVTMQDVRLTARQIVRADLKMQVVSQEEAVTVEARAELIKVSQ